jgi:hypothetical protein
VYKEPIVPPGFVVPERLSTDRMRLRPLTVHDAVKDYDAVMTSKRRLQTVFRPGGAWPEGLTLEQNLIELAWHQVEFQLRTSFAYTCVALDESQVLGCLYIYPTAVAEHDAMVTCWVRESEATTGLDNHLFETARAWIDRDWPFHEPGWPGRLHDWAGFRSAQF